METKSKGRNIYVSDEDYDYLGRIGNSYADGLRKAVEAHKALNEGKREGDSESGES